MLGQAVLVCPSVFPPHGHFSRANQVSRESLRVRCLASQRASSLIAAWHYPTKNIPIPTL